MRRPSGFTLIELMVVVAIIAILSAIAYPAYTDYITRARIADGISGLATMRVKMEQYFQDNRTYAGVSPTPAACTSTSIAPLPGNTAYFTYGCSNLTASTYTVTATGQGTMAGFVYTLDEQNVRATTGVPSGWTSNAACWVLKRDGSC